MAKSSFLSFAPTTSSSAKEIVVRKNAKNLTNPSDEHYYTQQEIESHSITPDTFRDRTLHQFKYLSEDFTWFIDEYEHGASAVKRYGINAAKIDLKKVKPDQIVKDPIISKDPSKTALHLYLPKDKDPYIQLDTMSKASDASKVENRAKEVVHEDLEIPTDPKGTSVAVRIKQASDVNTLKAYYKFENLIDKAIKTLSKFTGKKIADLSLELKPQFLAIVGTKKDNTTTLKELFDLVSVYTKSCSSEIQKIQHELTHEQEELKDLIGQVSP